MHTTGAELHEAFTTTDNGRLRGHAGASLDKTGLAVAIDEMLERRSVAEWQAGARLSWTPDEVR